MIQNQLYIKNKLASYFLFLFIMIIIFPFLVSADEFLGAPVITGGKVITKTDCRLEFKTELSHAEAFAFYKEALKGLKDIKFRDWKDSTYIEDDSNRAWHSITISKNDKDGAGVIIVKDNWTWIIGTLILRYIGVFMVIIALFIGMLISGKIISGSLKKLEKKQAAKS